MSLYKDLEIDDKATPQEIKRAYRKKAKKAHPDHGGKKGDFEKIQRAYLVLSDPETRRKYDKTGDDSLKDPDNTQSQILGIIVTAFECITQYIENSKQDPLEFDIAQGMRDAVTKKLGEIEQEIKKLEKNIKSTEKYLGRFTFKKGNNFIEHMLMSKIEGINLNIKFRRKDVEKFTKALELMEDMSFRVEPKKEKGYYSYSETIQFLIR